MDHPLILGEVKLHVGKSQFVESIWGVEAKAKTTKLPGVWSSQVVCVQQLGQNNFLQATSERFQLTAWWRWVAGVVKFGWRGGLNSGNLGGANSNIFGSFTPKPGEMIQFDGYFSNGLVQPPTRNPTFSVKSGWYWEGHPRTRFSG